MGAVAKSPHHEVGSKHPHSKFGLYAEKVLEAMRLGNTMPAAARQCGLNPETVHYWLYNGRKDPEKYFEYAEFAEKMEQIKAEVQAEMVDVVRQTALSGAPNTWQAAAWYLERSDPEHWSRRDRLSVSNEGGPLVQVNQVILSDENARAASRELLNRLTAGSPAEPLGPGASGELEVGRGGRGSEVIDVDSRPAR
jgi:hypothetical protein